MSFHDSDRSQTPDGYFSRHPIPETANNHNTMKNAELHLNFLPPHIIPKALSLQQMKIAAQSDMSPNGHQNHWKLSMERTTA